MCVLSLIASVPVTEIEREREIWGKRVGETVGSGGTCGRDRWSGKKVLGRRMSGEEV